MLKSLAAVAGTAILAAAIAAGVTQLGGDAERAVAGSNDPLSVAAPLSVAPKAIRTPARHTPRQSPSSACESDELSDSPSDNRDEELRSDGCEADGADALDPNGEDRPGPAGETGPDEAQGPDDSGNDP
jgi:hypothetical protein